MTGSTSSQQISFEKDAQLVDKLLKVLTREQSSLVISDVNAIESLMLEKSELLQLINITVKSRYAALAAKGFESNEIGMIAWLKSQNSPVINEAWQSFQKTLNQAKEMNRLNGMIISKHFNRNQQLLNHLQGNADHADVYAKNGQAKPSSSSRASLIV